MKRTGKILKGKIIHWNCGDVKRAERALWNVKSSYYKPKEESNG